MSNNVEALKAALLEIPDFLLMLPTQAVTEGYGQAIAKFNALMTGTSNPHGPPVAALLNMLGAQASSLEGAQEEVRMMIDRLIASM